MSAQANVQLLPRLIRLRDVPGYLGMDVRRFNQEVRPYLIEIPIGKQGIAFDRLDLDAWIEHYKSRSGRPAAKLLGGKKLWDVKKRQGFSNVGSTGTLINKPTAADFVKVLEQIVSKRPKNISPGELNK